jgi:hypothetical protein
MILLVASPADAAWAFISAAQANGTTGGNACNSATCSVTKSVTAGNLLIVGGIIGDGTSNPTLADGVNSWTQIGSTIHDTTNAESGKWQWAIAATTASITVSGTTFPNNPFNGLFIAEYRGNASSSPTDGQTGQNPAGSTATNGDTSGTFTTAANGDLVVGFIINQGAPTSAWATQGSTSESFTKRATASNDPGGTNSETWAVEDGVQTTASASTQAAWTAATTDTYIAFGAAFKVAGAAPSTPAPPMRLLLGVGT